MGSLYFINKDGSVTQNPSKLTVNNIKWVDYKQKYGKSLGKNDKAYMILFLIPVYGQLFFVLTAFITYLYWKRWFWPIQSIYAVQDTFDRMKIYCSKNGKLGVFSEGKRLVPAIFDSVERLPVSDYPCYILSYQGECCLYNDAQKKILFRNSDRIKFIGDNTVLVTKNGHESKYSLIGMRLS